MHKKLIVQSAVIVLLASALITAVHFFIAQPFLVSGDSMEPTFKPGDYLVIDELSYYLHAPRRGELVVFRYPLDPSIYFIKRLIGMPGDTVVISPNGAVRVKPQGDNNALLLSEPYLTAEGPQVATSTIVLGSTEYFVLGDNRDASFDSRVWGPVPQRYIIGRVWARLYPLPDAGLFPGAYAQKFGTTTASTTIHT